MPTPRWSILFQRIQCDSEAVRSLARPHPGSAGCPALGTYPVAGRNSAPAPSPSAASTLLVGGLCPAPIRGQLLARRLRARCGRHNPRQPARAAAPAGLFAWVSVLMPDSLFEFGEPLLHRPL